MPRPVLTILCLIVSAVSLRAQSSVVVPAGLGPRSGNASDAIGVGDLRARAQYLYGRSATGFRGGEIVTKVALRLDEGRATPARTDLNVAVRLSSRAVDPSRIPFARFDLNDGLVLGSWNAARLSLPAVVSVGRAQSFVDLPLSKPFVVDKDGTLCVDVKYSTTAKGPFLHRIDSERDYGDPFRSENYGRSCPPFLITGGSGFWVGNKSTLGAYTYVRGLRPGSVVISWLGSTRSSTLLPFTYGPYPCSIYSIALVFHPIPVVVPPTSDYARFVWVDAVKLADSKLAGVKLVAQHMAFEPSKRVAVTNGLEVVVGDGKKGKSFVTVFGSTSLNPKFDPDKDNASSFWSGAPVLQIR